VVWFAKYKKDIMKRFLVSLDGSELSEKVLPRWCRVHPSPFCSSGQRRREMEYWNDGIVE
jgi:hypothetical protein